MLCPDAPVNATCPTLSICHTMTVTYTVNVVNGVLGLIIFRGFEQNGGFPLPRVPDAKQGNHKPPG